MLAALLPAGGAQAAGRGADGKFDVRESSHFILHQDVDIDESGGFHGSRRFEQLVLAQLEHGYESLDRLLGLRPPRKIDVVVYDPGVFDARFRGLFRFAAAGFYRGFIVIRGATEMSYGLQRVLHHELVHAALDAAAPSFVLPGWLNEGLAEWFENRALGKRGLNQAEWSALRAAAANGGLYTLASLSAPAFGAMGQHGAQTAYLQSYATVDFLVRGYGESRLAQFVGDVVERRNLERSLRRVYRSDLGQIESRFFAELR